MPLNFEVTTIESRLAGWGMSVIFDDLQAFGGGQSYLPIRPKLSGSAKVTRILLKAPAGR